MSSQFRRPLRVAVVGWICDVLAEPVARIPWVRRQFVSTLMGVRTSPWTTWSPARGPEARPPG